MKPLLHAKVSVHKFGGHQDDYLEMHEWMDQTKMLIPDSRHRMVLHNAFGIYLGQQIFGVYFQNSKGKDICVRDVLEQHVLDDLGHIPTLEKCFSGLTMEPWMGSAIRGSGVLKMKIKDLQDYNIEVVD